MKNDKIDPTDKIHIEIMDYLGEYLCDTMGEAATHAEEITNIVIENFELLDCGCYSDDTVEKFNQAMDELKAVTHIQDEIITPKEDE